MVLFDHTFSTPAVNLAADEALLNMCEAGFDTEIIRFWEAREYFVVLGSTNTTASEIDLDACQKRRIPVFRRASGGGTVLQGPGCLSYALVLRIEGDPELGGIAESNRYIMNKQRRALQPIIEQQVVVRGFTDLTVSGRKFSGNSQRRKQKYLLFHGTVLLNFDLEMIEKTLRMPTRQPEYREERDHLSFLTNLRLAADDVKDALRKGWKAQGELERVPFDQIEELTRQRYDATEWIYRF